MKSATYGFPASCTLPKAWPFWSVKLKAGNVNSTGKAGCACERHSSAPQTRTASATLATPSASRRRSALPLIGPPIEAESALTYPRARRS